MRDFTPIAPLNLRGEFDETLLRKAETVCLQSAKLAGSHTPQVLEAVRDLLRIVNSYYSNKIESEGTHPIDIERAAKNRFSENSRERSLQVLSLAYIQTQREIEARFLDASVSPFEPPFILGVHKSLYAKPGMEPFLSIKEGDRAVMMQPGVLRARGVAVGNHIAPAADELPVLLNQYDHLYTLAWKNARQPVRLIYALSSHHRLTWIHPFLDGNGRTSRLILDGLFAAMRLEGYGLWNLSRALARNTENYKGLLAAADAPRQGDYDGKGNLSAKALAAFVEFMLDGALDQIDYMGRYLRLDELSRRIQNYVDRSRHGLLDAKPLPEQAKTLFSHLLLHGEMPRGEAAAVLNMAERTARNIVSDLVARGFLGSDTPKSALKLKFPARFAAHLFPELIPDYDFSEDFMNDRNQPER